MKILLATIEEKARRCQDDFMMTSSTFLDLAQRSAVLTMLRQNKIPYGMSNRGGQAGVHAYFYGGYDDCERTVCIFAPDYIDAENETELGLYFRDNPEENPLSLLRIMQNGYQQLSHRDYLGSLMGLGIKREMIGDILVREDGADILILKEMEKFLLSHYAKAGRVYLSAELLPLDQLIVPTAKTILIKDTVASLRLDNVIASAFKLSRAKAADAINAGLVFVNSAQMAKTDKLVSQGDKLVYRGKGKAFLKEIGNTTKKDRIYILIEKYL